MGKYLKIAGIVIGKKHLPVIPNLVTTAITYGVAASIFLVYVCDIHAVVKYIPFYNNNLRMPYEDDKRVYIVPRKDLKDL